MASTHLLRLSGIEKSFPTTDGKEPVRVLRNVDLSIDPGEKVSLIGPSGCGKSTLLSLIAGLLRPDAGEVIIDGVVTGNLDETARARLRAERIGIALQSDNLIAFLSARENVELAVGFGARGDRRRARERSMELLERFGVAHRADHRPRHLSGGETQRVALAVALANRPELLLADEVVGQLDGETAAHVLDEVLAAEFAVLYVTHHVALADRADRRYRLEDHEIEQR